MTARNAARVLSPDDKWSGRSVLLRDLFGTARGSSFAQIGSRLSSAQRLGTADALPGRSCPPSPDFAQCTLVLV